MKKIINVPAKTITPSGRTIIVWSDGEKLNFIDMMKKVEPGPNAAFVAENMANQARLRAKTSGYKAAYCTPEALESVKCMAPSQAIHALWNDGWNLSAERAKAKAESVPVAKAKLTNKPTPTADVIIEVATQFANLGDRKVVGWATKLAYVDHVKVLSGLMEDGATNGKAAIIAVTEAVQALKKPCAVKIIYDAKDRQLATLSYAMEHGFTTKSGKPSACMAQMAALQPYWMQHTFAATEVTSLETLRETARFEITKVVPVIAVAPVNTDDDEIEMML